MLSIIIVYFCDTHCSTGPTIAAHNVVIYIAVPATCFVLVGVIITLIVVIIITWWVSSHNKKGITVYISDYSKMVSAM